MTDGEVRAHVTELESLLEAVDGGSVRAIEALLTLYGEALRRVLDIAERAPDGAAELRRDELLAHLIVLHDLDPAAAGAETFVSLL